MYGKVTKNDISNPTGRQENAMFQLSSCLKCCSWSRTHALSLTDRRCSASAQPR